MHLIAQHFKGTAEFDYWAYERGAKFTKEQTAKAVRLDWWGSSFTDPGDDYNLFRLHDETGKVVAEKRVEGY